MPRCRILLEVKPGTEATFERAWSRFSRMCAQVISEVSPVTYGILLGPYDYLVEFHYHQLHEVAFVVLQSRDVFRDEVATTLTLLEGRSEVDVPTGGGPAMKFSCLMLIKAKPECDTEIGALCKEKGLACSDVLFGPYDYVIEFPVEGLPEMQTEVKRIREILGARISSTVALAKSQPTGL